MTISSIALRVQQMDVNDTAVVLAGLVVGRGDGSFTGRSLSDMYLHVGIPAPSKLSNRIAGLKRLEFARPGPLAGSWKLTPAGKARISELLTVFDIAALEAEALASNGSSLGGRVHSIVPPALAPAGIVAPLRRFLQAHPFERNVFGMTRFADPSRSPTDPVGPALSAARAACAAHGLELHLASDRAIADDLWANVAAHMWASHYGIAFFEDRVDRGMNYNLTIEVGSMLMTGRRCALLKDVSIAKMPTDLVGHIYKPVDLDDPATVGSAVHIWARDDLGMGACPSCPVK